MLEAAGELALQLRAELRGLFIEDANLLRLAELPIASEILCSSGQRSPISFALMSRELAAQADSLRRLVEQYAQRLRLPWSFSVVQDTLWRTCVSAGAEAELVLIGQRHTVPARYRRREAEQIVAVLLNGSPASHRALRIARQLAVSRPLAVQPILLVLPGDTADQAREPFQTELARCPAARLRPSVPVKSLDEARNFLRQHPPRLLLVSRTCPGLDPTSLENLLRGLDGPLGIVN